MELRQFSGVREAVVPEEVADFLEGGVFRQRFNGISGVDEFSFGPIDETFARRKSDDTFQSLVKVRVKVRDGRVNDLWFVGLHTG